jgi:TolB-like protein/DNA-binding winged helix-turn-helix (wHTH) protein/Flp pilus assembly protein TadD
MSLRNPELSSDANRFQLGSWLVVPGSGEIRNGETVVRVEPKVMDVLVYLARHQGKVVSRDELEREVWRGAIVGYDAVTSTVIKLRKALGDDPHAPTYIATVPKRGYQLIALISPVVAEPTTRPAAPSISPITAGPVSRRPRSPWQPGVIALALIATAGTLATIYLASQPPSELVTGQAPAEPVTKPPSIVVLPFENLGDAPQQEQFADGMTEDIVTDLSRLSDLRVIASNTSFAFKGRRATVQQVGAELGVDFVLDGSVRRSGDAVRINAQLVDARSGFQKWAERYDRPALEVFAVQDEVTRSIVRALALKLTPQESERLERQATDNLAAYDRFLEGQRLSRVYTKETNLEAEAAYRQAIELDPGYGRAYGALAYILASNYRRGWTDAPQLTLDRALELARKAVALDSSIPQTFWALGYVHLIRRELNEAESAVTQALAIAPNYADGYGLLAFIKSAGGDAQSALALIDKGIRLNPYYTWDYPNNRGLAHYSLGRIDEAIADFEEARSRNPNAVPARILLAASYARAGRLDEAGWEVEEILTMSPTDTISQYRNALPVADTGLMDALAEDLRKAGLPE